MGTSGSSTAFSCEAPLAEDSSHSMGLCFPAHLAAQESNFRSLASPFSGPSPAPFVWGKSYWPTAGFIQWDSVSRQSTRRRGATSGNSSAPFLIVAPPIQVGRNPTGRRRQSFKKTPFPSTPLCAGQELPVSATPLPVGAVSSLPPCHDGGDRGAVRESAGGGAEFGVKCGDLGRNLG